MRACFIHITSWIYGAFRDVLRILFQTTCLVCDNSAEVGDICISCKPVCPIQGRLCEKCGDPLEELQIQCRLCSEFDFRRFVTIRSMLWLNDDAKTVLHRIKFDGSYEFLSLYKRAVAKYFEICFPQDITVIPVPLHIDRLIERGFNQSEILASWIAKNFQLKVRINTLRKTKSTPAQSSLSKEDRLNNLRNSFVSIGKEAPPDKVLLVDDVFTTGSTLRHTARTLQGAGTGEVYAWTLFRTPRLFQRGCHQEKKF